MYRTIYGYCGLKFESFITLSDNSTRGHCFKIQKQYSRVNCRAFSFANRCIDAWNNLDSDVLCASSVQSFKRRLKYVLILLSFCMFYRDGISVSLPDHP